MSGPSSVFSTANQISGKTLYNINLLSYSGGLVHCSAKFALDSQSLKDYHLDPHHTVLAMGAYSTHLSDACDLPEHLDFLRKAASHSARMGSICSGTFLLGVAGLLDDRKVTTHWRGCKKLQAAFPKAKVEPDALYVRDKSLWTSAGVTTGIDMALAMLEVDHGKALMGQVARNLILYSHRPGKQSQFSDLLDAQLKISDEFKLLVLWIEAHLHRSIRVNQLAAQMNMSERTFYRRFITHFSLTPSKFVELIRLQKSREYLETELPIKQIIARVGFHSEAGFRSAFEKQFGILPSMHRKMNSPKPSSSIS